MGQRKTQKAPDTPDGRSHGLYLYCLGELEALAPLFGKEMPPPIEPDAQFMLVEEAGLAAVASAVTLADYGEEALQGRVADAAWLAVRAMRHEKVVEHFARRASVVPLRFGAVYLRRENVEAMLAERQEGLRAIIERLRGKDEWGLNVYCDRARLTEAVATLSPKLREMGERAGAAAPGQSYLLRKKIDALRETEARAEIKRAAARIEEELSALSDAAARLRVLKGEAGERGEAAAKFAFLVGRERFDEFRAGAERLAQAYAGAGFALELTGPWPAYNFASGGAEERKTDG